MGFCLDVRGDFACFTRPEMKVERVSYDLITPSAARAIFEAVLWKPAIRWHIHKIELLSPVSWLSLRRNEVGNKLPVTNITKAMNGKGAMPVLHIEEERQQRASLLLRDVHYRIHADFELTDKAGPGDNAGKFSEMFRRRARRGQCIYQPYLGCREFACDFRLIEEDDPQPAPLALDEDLGWMLYDLDFSQPEPSPQFFRARLQQGVLQLPLPGSEEIRG